jgi:hypothetical protein
MLKGITDKSRLLIITCGGQFVNSRAALSRFCRQLSRSNLAIPQCKEMVVSAAVIKSPFRPVGRIAISDSDGQTSRHAVCLYTSVRELNVRTCRESRVHWLHSRWCQRLVCR